MIAVGDVYKEVEHTIKNVELIKNSPSILRLNKTGEISFMPTKNALVS